MEDGEYRWDIKELLHRRTDLSTFVIHWSRDTDDGVTALDNLKRILDSGLLKARSPMGAAGYTLRSMRQEGTLGEKALDKALRTQHVVCFTETPLEQAWSIVCDIEGRENRLKPYGLAFTKVQARTLGINPVWYLDMTPGHDWLTNHVATLVKRAALEGTFGDDPISKLTPFMEGMGKWNIGPSTSKKEFWWEREWRHVGNLQFDPFACAVVLCPELDFDEVQALVEPKKGRTVPLIDPNWGLEHIIAKLANVPEV